MSKVLSGGKLAGGNPENGRVENDFYATNPLAVEMLDKVYPLDCNDKYVLDPCVGQGHILNKVKELYPVAKCMGVDIVDRGYENTMVRDYINECPVRPIGWRFDLIITNPPYSLASEFVDKSIQLLRDGGKCCMFLKIQFLEGQKRKELFDKYPPRYIYVFRNRMATWNNGQEFDPKTGKHWSTTMCHAWFVWEKGFKGEPIIRWLDKE